MINKQMLLNYLSKKIERNYVVVGERLTANNIVGAKMELAEATALNELFVKIKFDEFDDNAIVDQKIVVNN